MGFVFNMTILQNYYSSQSHPSDPSAVTAFDSNSISTGVIHLSRMDSSQRRRSCHRGNRPPSRATPLESHSTSYLGALQGPSLALIIVSMTMRHAQCISASSDKQWSFTKTRRSLRQLVKSMLRVSRLIKPSSLSSDTVSIVPRRLSTARWLEWNAHQSESWAGLMIPCAAY